LNQTTVITDQETDFTGGDLLLTSSWEHPGESQVSEIEDLNEVGCAPDPTVLQFRHSFGSLSDYKIHG